MGSALSLGSLCIASINARLQGTPLGAHVWQGTEVTYWRSDSQTFLLSIGGGGEGAYPLANLDWGSKSALHRNNRLITLLLSRTVWRDGWREIGRPTSEGCLRYPLRRWYRYLWKASLSNMGITSKRELHEAVNINKPVKWIRN